MRDFRIKNQKKRQKTKYKKKISKSQKYFIKRTRKNREKVPIYISHEKKKSIAVPR